MVVMAPGVGGGASSWGWCSDMASVPGWGRVAYPKNENGLTFGENLVGISAAFAGALSLQIGHFAMKPGGQPAFVHRVVGRCIRDGHTNKLEAEPPGFSFDGLG